MIKEKLAGIERLKGAVAYDQEREPGFHDYQGKLDWIIDRAKHYEEKTGISYLEVIEKWEEKRDYWYMNYYQDCNQPLLTNNDVHVFDTVEDFKKAVGTSGFRCPKCEGVSKSPYECSCAECDWKSYGLFRTMGKGIYVFVKDKMVGNEFFKPIEFEVKGHEK